MGPPTSCLGDEGLATRFLGAKWRKRVELIALLLNAAAFNIVLSDLSCTWVTQSIKILFNPLHRIKLQSTARVEVGYLPGWLK